MLLTGVVSGPSGDITIDTSEYSIGEHMLTVTATDSKGNSFSQVVTFTTAAGKLDFEEGFIALCHPFWIPSSTAVLSIILLHNF